jgi:hypothetical protein
MTDDGGYAQAGVPLQAEIALNHRVFVYETLASGIAVALMRGAVFKDTKVSPSPVFFWPANIHLSFRYFRSYMSKGAYLIIGGLLTTEYGRLGTAQSFV